MATTNEKVYTMVEQEIAKNPEVTVDELYDKAVKVDSGISKLTKRQFNARYSLQVKRQLGNNGTTSTKKEAPAATVAVADDTPKKKRGRPKGSKNAPKTEAKTETPATPAPAAAAAAAWEGNGEHQRIRGTLLLMAQDLSAVGEMTAPDLFRLVDHYTGEITGVTA
jgi:hypothetical protein